MTRRAVTCHDVSQPVAGNRSLLIEALWPPPAARRALLHADKRPLRRARHSRGGRRLWCARIPESALRSAANSSHTRIRRRYPPAAAKIRVLYGVQSLRKHTAPAGCANPVHLWASPSQFAAVLTGADTRSLRLHVTHHGVGAAWAGVESRARCCCASRPAWGDGEPPRPRHS